MASVHVFTQGMMMPPNMPGPMSAGPGAFGGMPGAIPPPLMPGAPSVGWLPPPGGDPAGSLGMPSAMMGTAPGSAPPGVATADSRSNQYVFGAVGGTVERAGGCMAGRVASGSAHSQLYWAQEGWRVSFFPFFWLIWAGCSVLVRLCFASVAHALAASCFPFL